MKFAGLILLIVFAQNVRGCDATGIAIYFGNGMFNSMNDVQNSVVELKNLDLKSIDPDPTKIRYKTALNLNESDLDNILSVIREKTQGDLSYFWEVIEGSLPIPDWLDAPIRNALLSSVHLDTLGAMIEQYSNDLQSGEKVILVSHSQGNFYAEESEKRLMRKNNVSDLGSLGFGNVRVATPAKSLLRFPYFTFKDDLIIGLVRHWVGAPEPNLETIGSGLFPYLDPRGHDFVKAYLRNAESREKIRQAIIEQANHSQVRCSISG